MWANEEADAKINSILKRWYRKGDKEYSRNRGTGTTTDEQQEELLIFGYSCKLFRDDDKARDVDKGCLLIPCQGDNNLRVDRYDCRGMLSSNELAEAEASCNNWQKLTPTEERVEKLCDEERYRALYCDEDEEKMYKEEEQKRLHDSSYGQVSFNYDGNQPESTTETKLNEPTSSKEDDEPFVPSEKLTIPPGMPTPDTQKLNAIIEKTAKFIATQGTQMEILLKAKQAGNSQFEFLSMDCPLHAYYRYLLSSIRDGTYKPDEEIKEEKKEEEDEHYLHPSLAPVESAPSIPSIAYKPSADCAYSMLVTKITGRSEKLEDNIKTENVPSPDTISLPRDDTTNPDYPSNEHGHHLYMQQENAYPMSSVPEIAKGPVLYSRSTSDNQSQSSFTNQMKLEEAELSNLSLEHSISSNTNSPKPDFKTKSSALGLTQYYNSDDSDSDNDSQSESIEVPPGNEQVIVDKMASYVAKNGDDFEAIVKTKGDPRFCFLNPNHKYFKYYRHKVEFYKRANKPTEEKTVQNQSSTTPSKKEKEPKTPKVIVPVSFSIKKIKEPEPVLPKPALPYESSSDEEENKEKVDNPSKEEEKPKVISIKEISDKEKIQAIVNEAVAATMPIKQSNPLPTKEIQHKKCENIPPPIVVQEISLSDFLAAQTAQMPMMIQVPKPEIITVFPPVKHIPIAPTPKADSSSSKSSTSRRKLDIKKDIQRRIQELSSPSSSDSESKGYSVKKHKKSRSKMPQLNKVDLKTKTEEEPKSTSAPDYIDLTDELYNLDSSNGKEGDKNKIQCERKKKAAAFLSSLKTVPAAPLQQHHTLASAMVKTLHNIQDGKEKDSKRRRSSSNSRKSKRHKRDRSHSSDSDYDKNRDSYRHKRRSHHHHSKKSKRRSRDRSSSRHRRKSDTRDRDKGSKSSRHDNKPKAIELPKVDEEYINARQKSKLLTSSLKDLVREARKDLTCSEPIKMAVDIFANESSTTPTVDVERSRSKTTQGSSSENSSDSYSSEN